MWRSLLFIPVLEDRFIQKAASRGADALVLDLEASIPDNRKAEARNALPAVVEQLAPHVAVTVRINPSRIDAKNDLEACVIPGVQTIHIALCENAEHIQFIDGVISELEAKRDLETGSVKLIAMIETADSTTRAVEIAKASPRLIGLTLGVEDYATSMGTSANQELLRPAVFQIIQAARAAGIYPITVPVSLADFSDINALEAAAEYARALGSVGGYAVHPAQVETLNRVFSPTEDEINWSRAVVAACKDPVNEGKGAFKVAGQMIDKPLIDRALFILDQVKTD